MATHETSMLVLMISLVWHENILDCFMRPQNKLLEALGKHLFRTHMLLSWGQAPKKKSQRCLEAERPRPQWQVLPSAASRNLTCLTFFFSLWDLTIWSKRKFYGECLHVSMRLAGHLAVWTLQRHDFIHPICLGRIRFYPPPWILWLTKREVSFGMHLSRKHPRQITLVKVLSSTSGNMCREVSARISSETMPRSCIFNSGIRKLLTLELILHRIAGIPAHHALL